MQGLYNPAKDHIVTAASCTTNCLAPIVKVIHEKFGIVKGAITTIHCVTNTQTIMDAPNHKKTDLRRARSGLMNLAPTSTGSATAIALIFPELQGKLNGVALIFEFLHAHLSRTRGSSELHLLMKFAERTRVRVLCSLPALE